MILQEKYLRLLKSSLLNLLYLESEVRLLYVFSRLAVGQPVDTEVVRRINEKLPKWMEDARRARDSGKPYWNVEFPDGKGGVQNINLRSICEFSHTMIGKARMDNIHACLDSIREDNIPGDLIETGVWRGGASIFMRGYLSAWDITDRMVWCADSFQGLPVPSLPQDAGHDYSAQVAPSLAVSLEEVQDNFKRYDLLDDQVRFLKGWFADTLPSAPIGKLAVLRLDGDLYESTMDALKALYDKVSVGGFIIVDDYGDFEPCRLAITEFRELHGISDPIHTVDWACSYWRKS